MDWILIITISNKIEKLKHQLYHLNRLESEMQVLETALEREPQTVVQLCLFILMNRFKRIRLLFSSYFGISIEIIFGVTWALTLFSISNTVYGYLHSKRWPISPGFLGTIVQLIAIGGLVASKLLLIAITLLNAVYLHIFLYGSAFAPKNRKSQFSNRITHAIVRINIWETLGYGLFDNQQKQIFSGLEFWNIRKN